MTNKIELGSGAELTAALLGAQDQFMYGDVNDAGVGFDFLNNRQAFIDAVRTLRLDLLMDETPPAIVVPRVVVQCGPTARLELSGNSIDFTRHSFVGALDIAQTAGMTPSNVGVSSRILIAHSASMGSGEAMKPIMELSSEWHAPGLLSDVDTLSRVDDVLPGYSSQLEHDRLTRLAQLLEKGEYDLSPPSQTYCIKIGRPVLDFFEVYKGVNVQHWYDASGTLTDNSRTHTV